MKKFYFLISFIFSSYFLSAQITFQKTYGGTLSDQGHSVQQTTDGGYIIAGSTSSFGAGGNDIYLIKTYANGDTLWTKTFGGTSDDFGYSVQQTSDGGFIIVGETNSFGVGIYDVYLIKTNTNGDTMWTKTYGGTTVDAGFSVQQTTDGGFIITGYSLSFNIGNYDVYLIKTDINGDSLWTRTYGGANNDYGSSVQQTLDGGYIIAGFSYSFGAGNGDVYLLKTDSIGNSLWAKSFGGTNWDMGLCVKQTNDGSYMVAGWIGGLGSGGDDFYINKIDTSGNSLWSKIYGGPYNDFGRAAEKTIDGGYIIVGKMDNSGTGIYDVYLVKTDSIGNLLWSKTFGGTNEDDAFSVQQTTDGGYIISGSTNSFGAGGNDVYLIKTDSMGNSGCSQSNPATIVTTPATIVTTPATIVTTPTTVVTTPATIVGSGGTVTTLCTSVGITPVSDLQADISIFPNPAKDELIVRSSVPDSYRDGENKNTQLKIFDVYGKEILSQRLFSPNTELKTTNFSSGIYFVKIFKGEKNFFKKIIINH